MLNNNFLENSRALTGDLLAITVSLNKSGKDKIAGMTNFSAIFAAPNTPMLINGLDMSHDSSHVWIYPRIFL